MPHPRFLFLSLLLFGWATSSAAAQVLLKPGLHRQAGEKTRLDATMTSQQVLTLAGTPLESKTSRSTVLTREVLDISGPRTTIRSQYRSMQVNAELPGGQSLGFDSDHDAPDFGDGPIADLRTLLKVAFHTPWTTILEDGNVIAVEVDEQALLKIPESLRNDFSSDQLKQLETIDNERLPGKEVNAGDHWTREEQMPLGQGQVFTINKTYTYDGQHEHQGRKLDKILISLTSISYSVLPNSSLPLSVKDSNLTLQKGEGVLWYDSEQQQMVELNESMQVTGEITFLVAAEEYPATLELTINQQTTVTPE